jgi:CHAT domain-containing protein/tetratricopeptide (TPR) repeat protein
MAEGRNVREESLEDKEGRLLRELEELKRAERVRELERELAKLKYGQRIKALEHQVEEQKRAEEVRNLERQVEEVQNQTQLDPESSCDVAPTRDPDTRLPLGIDKSHGLVPDESTTCDDSQQAQRREPTIQTSTSSEAIQSNSPASDRRTEASIPMDHRPDSRDNHQRDLGSSLSDFGIGANTKIPSISEAVDTRLDMEAGALQYYQELDGPADDSPELLFYDMDLEQLYDFANTWEGNQEKKVGDLRMLSRLYYFIFTRTGTLDDIQKAIHRAEKAVEATHTDDVDYTPGLRDLIVMLLKKHERTNSLEDLDRAILFTEVMITVTPALHHDRTHRVIGLVKMKFKRALQTGSTEDLDEAMIMGLEAREMLQGAGIDSPRHHLERFRRTDNLDDLQMAIRRNEDIVEATPRDRPERAYWLNNLAGLLQNKFQRTSDLNDLQMAIRRGEEAVGEATRHNHPDRLRWLNNLAASLDIKFTETGNLNDLHIAIEKSEEAVAATPIGHPDRATMLSNLANFYETVFKRTGNIEDINMAIKSREEAVVATSPYHDSRAAKLNDLCVSLRLKSESTGDINDLRTSIDKGEEAVAATPLNCPERARRLVSLANALQTRFGWTGNVKDLHIAISRTEEAIAATSPLDENKPGRLSNLATLLRTRSEHTGDANDLHIAIERGEEAVSVTSHNDSETASVLDSLANSYRMRFQRTGDLDDLHMAIKRGEEAVAATPPNHINLPHFLSNLAVAFRARFQRMGDLGDLHMAIKRSEEAVLTVPPDHPTKGRKLNSLANCLRVRFQWTHNLDDLQIAIRRAEEAVAATPLHLPDRVGRLTNLATLLQTRSEHTGDTEDLRMAIQKNEEAVEAVPHDYPVRASMMMNLAASLRARSQQTRNPLDSERAVSLFVAATEMGNVSPRNRIESAYHATEILANNRNWSEANRITEIAVELLPAVAPRQLKQQDQQHILGEFAGLAALAASAALEAGKDASHATQLLELGRGIITGLRFGLRTDLAELREQHPEMAGKFEKLRNILDSPMSDMLDPFTEGDVRAFIPETNDRHNAGFELEKIIYQIRRLPSFENFLRPPPATDLRAAASQGPIVLINVSAYRSDAFIVETQAIRAIRLPNLRQSDIAKNVELMRSIRSAHVSSLDVTTQMSRMLEWLWDVAVRPTLDELGFTAPPSDDNWPRVWWIPTGQLSLLPLHAAGRQSPLSKETTLDRVVSSYTPSIKALLYARENSQKKNPSSAPDKALLVSMDTTPGHSDLRFAKEEVEKLASSLPDSIPRVILERPLRETVLSALNTCTIFHFAGHGESHPSDPSRSSLLITDWEKNPLMFEDLIGLNLSQKSPWLAYLSACSTSENQTENLHDEAIHLVTACQLAGFQHVVGSLWEVSDQYSVNVAEEVYKTIVDDGVIDGEKISWGVHNAVRRLRDITSQSSEHRYVGSLMSGEEESLDPRTRGARRVRPEGYEEGDTNEGSDPLVWAAYIHVGL